MANWSTKVWLCVKVWNAVRKKNKSFVWFLTFPMLPFGDSVDVSKYNYALDFKEGSAHVRAQACTKCLLILHCSGGCMNCDMI